MVQIPILVATISGIANAIICCSLLIAAQKHQYWIYYTFTETGSVSFSSGFFTLTTAYTAVLKAEIGLYDTHYTLDTDFANSLAPDTSSSDTTDSAKTGYFEEEAVKASRALAIISTLTSLGAAVCGILSLVLPPAPTKILRISAISVIASTAFLATIALIVTRTQFKSGMEIRDSFYMGITADLMAVVSTGCFIAAFVLSQYVTGNKTEPVDNGKPALEAKKPEA